MRRAHRPLAALTLVLALLLGCIPAGAASPALVYGTGAGGAARLTLQELGSRDVYSVQLELTLEGSGAAPSFSAAGPGVYSRCVASAEGGRTRVTLYLDSTRNLNQGGSTVLGDLTLSGGALPGSAALTLLDHALTPGDSVTVAARDSRGSGTGSSRPGGSSSGSDSSGSDSGSGSGSGGPAPARLPFYDVPEDSWFYDAVRYVYQRKLMSGTSSNLFSPDLTTSRGMIVAILYRLAGSPDAGLSRFTDVDPEQYYARAVAWAAEHGVVSGYSSERFGPDDPITREQLSLILWGFTRLQGRDVSARADLSPYADREQISPYAVEAMRWAIAEGLISGTSTDTLTPGGQARRAQAAVILRGLCENILDSD